MSESAESENLDPEYKEAQKRVKKLKNFYKDLTSWAGTSIVLLALDFFLTGGISWSKYPVFFWGIFVVAQVFDVIRWQKLDKSWEEKQMKRFTSSENKTVKTVNAPPAEEKLEDYSDELMNKRDREMANLSDYRQLHKPWKDEDLV